MKKISGMMLAAIMVLCACLAQADVSSHPDYGLVWYGDTGVCAISGYYGEEEYLVVPDLLEDDPITGIDRYAFQGNHTLIRVTIPDSITFIGTNPFLGCSNLRQIVVSPGSEHDVFRASASFCVSTEQLHSFSQKLTGH